jgi:hypothetical protein
MRIVYVDGFRKQESPNPKFVKKMRKRAKKLYGGWLIEPFAWGSERGKWKHIAADYLKNQSKARFEAKRFAEENLTKPEDEKLYIIAHSMGCLLVLSAFKELGAIPEHVGGTFFLAPAVPHNFSFDRIKFSEGQLIYNYFSNKDSILRLPYEGIEHEPAAGRQGFSNDLANSSIMNLNSNLAHRHHSWLARPLTELIGFWEGLDTAAQAMKTRDSSSRGGKQLWTEIYSNSERTIQRHLVTGHSRLIECNPPHRRLAISKEIGPLMKVIDLDRESLRRALTANFMNFCFNENT